MSFRLKSVHTSRRCLAASITVVQALVLMTGAAWAQQGEEARVNAEAPELMRISSDAEADSISPAEWQNEYLRATELVKQLSEDASGFHDDVETYIQQKYNAELKRIQSTYDSRYEELDKELTERRNKNIQAFERFIRKYPRSEHTPMAMFRLAELYYDEASYAFIADQLEYDRLLASLPEDEEAPEEPRYDFGKSLALYERIVEAFPHFKNLDGVYYMQGYLYGKELALQYDPERARTAWELLLASFPESEYASQAYLRLGEYWFSRGGREDYLQAIKYYQKVMEFQDNWYDRALYKVAWSYYNLSDYDNAIARFIELIDYSEKKEEQGSRESNLKAEAIEYLAISFADNGDVNDALATFERLGGRPYEREVIKRLADVYYRQAFYDDAIATYEKLQEIDPYNPENPEFQKEIVHIYQTLPIPDLEEANRAKAKLVEVYGEGSEWASRQGTNRAAVAKAQELAQTMLKELAYYYHRQAEETDDVRLKQEYYARAADKYREYLERYPYARDAFELDFYFAECLFYSGRFEEAVAQYRKAMTSSDPKYHADAAHGMVDAYRNMVARREGDVGVNRPFPNDAGVEGAADDADSIPKPIPLSELKKAYVEAIDVMARLAPDDEETPKFMYIAGQIYYFHHQYDVSRERFQELIDRYASHPLAVNAAANLVDGLIRQHDWVEVQKAVDRIVALDLGGGGDDWYKVREQLVAARRQARLKEAEELARGGNYLEAHKQFKESGTPEGLLNAAKIMDGRGMVVEAIQDYSDLVERFPQSEHVPLALFRIAANYEKFFDLPRAIEYYERLAREYPQYERAPDSINNAALLRVGLHQYKDAARAYERYARDYPDQPDAEVLYFRAGKLYMKAESYRDAVRLYRDYLRRYARVNGDRQMAAYLNLINALEKAGSHREALSLEKKANKVHAAVRDLPTFTALGANRYAEILFKSVSRTLEAFRSVKLEGNSRALAAALERKTSLKETLEDEIKAVIRVGDLEWSTAAFYTAGLMYQDFADALRNAVPPDLSEEDQDLYVSMLEENYIFPFEDKALEYYRRNLEIESAKKMWNEWIEKTYVQLNRLRPDLYPKRHKEELLFSPGVQYFLAPPLSPGDENVRYLTGERMIGSG